MELRQITYFIEVAKREHVTEAALNLDVAQSAVSRQIFNLEEELGVQLFIREGRTVRLTTIGRVFLNHMIQVDNTIKDARQVIEEYTDPEKGTIHLGFPNSLGTHIVPDAIAAFRQRHPDVKFKLSQLPYHSLKRAVARGEMNIALLGPVPMNDKKLHGRILFTENFVALLPAKHRLAGDSSITLRQVSGDAFVLFPEGYILRTIVEDFCSNAGFHPKTAFEGEDLETIKGLVSAGLGISLVPEVALHGHVPRGTVSMPITEANVRRTVGVIMPQVGDLLPTEKIFHHFLQDLFARLERFQKQGTGDFWTT